MKQWYALHTKPNSERQVAQALADRGLEPYLPIVRRQWRGGWREMPFFPCYMFAHFDIDEVGISAVSYTPGLRRLVSFGPKPATVPEVAVEIIRQKLDQIADQGGLPALDLLPGDRVRIVEGPLEGLHAVFEGPMGPAERVRILIQFLGQVNRAEVPAASLERVRENKVAKRQRGTRGRGRWIRGRQARGTTASAAQEVTDEPATGVR
jgi:transcriptional antiterminator RfaH